MRIEEIREAYKACLSLRHKKRKTVPYKELDKVLFVVEEFLEFMNTWEDGE